ncbi:hypothetical protein AVEN_204293-1 [Araneus ventricosus]|uniref:Uncharacterized protein n=1 Tax=Araneus ventricosus TaxID=182803 RepID=A0A4Y2GW18_ARAVE|nr:hypothetical protein AVEN_204293-1 [Araneus ventricosus]
MPLSPSTADLKYRYPQAPLGASVPRCPQARLWDAQMCRCLSTALGRPNTVVPKHSLWEPNVPLSPAQDIGSTSCPPKAQPLGSQMYHCPPPQAQLGHKCTVVPKHSLGTLNHAVVPPKHNLWE